MLVHNRRVAGPAAAGRLFVRTADGSGLTAHQMTLHLLAAAVFAASVWARYRKLWTHNLMTLQRVGGVGFDTIFTINNPFGTRINHVGFQAVAGNPLAAFIFTIQGFETAHVLMHINVCGGKRLFAVGTINSPVRACVHDMDLHVDTG